MKENNNVTLATAHSKVKVLYSLCILFFGVAVNCHQYYSGHCINVIHILYVYSNRLCHLQM